MSRGQALKTIAIIQTRMGSTRLPGKVMADVAGKPLLRCVLDRTSAIQGIDQVVLATTSLARERPLIQLAKTCAIEVFAGSEVDVLDRYYRTALAFSADTIVRITADCPLLDPKVSERVVAAFCSGAYDYVSNVHPPTFPDGLDTEVFSFVALERAWREGALASEREHVTPYIWKNPSKFRIFNVANDRDLSSLRWTVDEPADLEFVRAVYSHLSVKASVFGMQEVLGLLSDHPELQRINYGIPSNLGYCKSLQEDRAVR
jgi:spore coat polysaccharide biosynthesis protein SpsF (cytidylyltransferase family)